VTNAQTHRRRGALALAIAASAALLAGCGDSSSSSSSTERSGASTAAATADLQPLFEGEGYAAPAVDGPAPKPGKHVYVISCGENQSTCNVASAAAVAAAKSIGWRTTLVDSRSDPTEMTNGIRRAIAARADGVIAYGIDCPVVKQALAEARSAGLRTAAAESSQCAEGGYDTVVTYAQGDFPRWFAAFGAAQAKALIANTDGSAKTIVLHETDVPDLEFAYRGFLDEYATCDGCEIAATIDFASGDFGSKLEQKVQQALVQHPDANAVYLPYDAVLDVGAMAALRASGRLPKLTLALAEGQSSTMAALRDGTFRGAGVGVPQVWEAYQSVDDLVRSFAGASQVRSGIGIQAYDADHNLPDSGPWQPPIDFRAAYAERWGAGAP